MEVTVRVRRKQPIESQLQSPTPISREEYEKLFGADDADIDLIKDFASAHHLSVSQVEKGRRSIIVKGKVSDFENAFGVQLACYKNDDGTTFRGGKATFIYPKT